MSKLGMWNKAAEVAKQTPEDRNRYVDLLRALSISAVVFGHWLMAAPYWDSGSAKMDHLLDIQEWSRWLTWIFQVMPVFFFVGGFSNGVSWDGAQNKGQLYSQWLEARMRRLLGPVVPLVLLWGVLGIIGYLFSIPTGMTRIASQVALVPVWFLAIYFVIVMLVPISRAAWHRYGFWSVITPMMLAVIGDLIYFNSAQKWLGWFNYLFVWSAVHQLGYAWQQGSLSGAEKSGAIKLFALGCLGLIALIALTILGPYPLSLVGVPSQELSNTTPPKITLLALGLTQIGFLLSIESPMRRWLSRGKVWTSTVLVNGLIMPIFLWHSTVMMLLIGASFWLLPNLLLAIPGSSDWWLLRPVWIWVYLIFMLVLLPLFLGLEKVVTANERKNSSLLRIFIAGVLMCVGLALLAANGVTGDGPLGLNWLACTLPIIGGFVALFRTPKIFLKK